MLHHAPGGVSAAAVEPRQEHRELGGGRSRATGGNLLRCIDFRNKMGIKMDMTAGIPGRDFFVSRCAKQLQGSI